MPPEGEAERFFAVLKRHHRFALFGHFTDLRAFDVMRGDAPVVVHRDAEATYPHGCSL